MRHPGRSDGADRVTIEDVAAAAGVSTASVSRALARPDRVSAALAARVRAVATALRYVPNPAARALSSLHTREVAALVNDLPAHAAAVGAAIGRLQDAGWTVTIASFDRELGPGPAIQAAIDRDVEGVLLVGASIEQPVSRALAERGLPWVAIVAKGAEAGVEIDFTPAARALARHLFALGHRRATCLLDRREGDSGWLAAAASALAANGFGVVHARLADLCATPATEWPTAIVCADDLAALEVVRAGDLRGIAVPNAVSVIGNGNHPFCALASPPLTTVEVPWTLAGATAADRLLAWREQRCAGVVALNAKLVLRRSCGPPCGFT